MTGFVVVGVTPQQPDILLRQAARFARCFEAVLVCATVDPASYVVAEHPDGSVTARPLDPDLPDWCEPGFDDAVAERIRAVAAQEQVEVAFRELAGDVAHALGRLAEVLEADMVIVGSRGGPRATMHDLIGGSVAAHLMHRQLRPVVVIPLSHLPTGGRQR